MGSKRNKNKDRSEKKKGSRSMRSKQLQNAREKLREGNAPENVGDIAAEEEEVVDAELEVSLSEASDGSDDSAPLARRRRQQSSNVRNVVVSPSQNVAASPARSMGEEVLGEIQDSGQSPTKDLGRESGMPFSCTESGLAAPRVVAPVDEVVPQQLDPIYD